MAGKSFWEARPTYDEHEIQGHAHVLYRWDYQTHAGTYQAFDKYLCVEIERQFRMRAEGAWVWGSGNLVGRQEAVQHRVNFQEMTACFVGSFG